VDWDALGAIGEVLGAVAVFLTLLYLAAQIRQTNKMARFETTREIMGQFNACNQLYATDAINQGLVDETLYNGAGRDVRVAMGRWPNMRQPVERWLNNYPELLDSEFSKAVDNR
jgi:hypothetical protein